MVPFCRVPSWRNTLQKITSSQKIILFSGVLGLFALGVFNYVSQRRTTAFSAAMLTSLWHDFQKTYVESSTGRTAGNDAQDITTSQDQAMTLLRAVWMNDQSTFNEAWNWMKIYLKHKDDTLFSGRYGKRPDGSYGIFTGGQGSASGADADAALALLFAYARWGQPIYQQTARLIMNDIWTHDVLIVNNRPYLLAGSAEKAQSRVTVLVSPGEFPLYALRIFAGLDETHDWNGLINSSYDLLQKSTLEPLDKKRSAHIVPDFFLINRTNGAIVPGPMPAGTSTDFGYQALRTPWRLALDWQWFKDERTKTALTNLELLGVQWRSEHRLASAYTHDGKSIDDEELPAMYGGTLGYFLLTDPQAVIRIRDEKIMPQYDSKRDAFRDDVNSFNATWMWLGLALSQGTLTNLLPAASLVELHDQFIREQEIPTQVP